MTRIIVGGVLPLGRDAVIIFYSPGGPVDQQVAGKLSFENLEGSIHGVVANVLDDKMVLTDLKFSHTIIFNFGLIIEQRYETLLFPSCGLNGTTVVL